jgi:hypothetical protein
MKKLFIAVVLLFSNVGFASDPFGGISNYNVPSPPDATSAQLWNARVFPSSTTKFSCQYIDSQYDTNWDYDTGNNRLSNVRVSFNAASNSGSGTNTLVTPNSPTNDPYTNSISSLIIDKSLNIWENGVIVETFPAGTYTTTSATGKRWKTDQTYVITGGGVPGHGTFNVKSTSTGNVYLTWLTIWFVKPNGVGDSILLYCLQ